MSSSHGSFPSAAMRIAPTAATVLDTDPTWVSVLVVIGRPSGVTPDANEPNTTPSRTTATATPGTDNSAMRSASVATPDSVPTTSRPRR